MVMADRREMLACTDGRRQNSEDNEGFVSATPQHVLPSSTTPRWGFSDAPLRGFSGEWTIGNVPAEAVSANPVKKLVSNPLRGYVFLFIF
jgi:hypothetical protein